MITTPLPRCPRPHPQDLWETKVLALKMEEGDKLRLAGKGKETVSPSPAEWTEPVDILILAHWDLLLTSELQNYKIPNFFKVQICGNLL